MRQGHGTSRSAEARYKQIRLRIAAYSVRNARMGSTDAARRAGIQHATRAIAARNGGTTAKVNAIGQGAKNMGSVQALQILLLLRENPFIASR